MYRKDTKTSHPWYLVWFSKVYLDCMSVSTILSILSLAFHTNDPLQYQPISDDTIAEFTPLFTVSVAPLVLSMRRSCYCLITFKVNRSI